jgi:hypothetical protein
MIKHTLYTIGFTGCTAEDFFARLKAAGVKRVIDTRLWADTQLSGFARKKDLGFFLKNLVGIDCEHRLDLAPTAEILRDFKDKKIDWQEYQSRYITLLQLSICKL